MANGAGNKRNANILTMWVMLTQENAFEIVWSTTAGMENRVHTLIIMISKWNVHLGWQSSEGNLAWYTQFNDH
jgi:hypothetical protein